MRLSVLKCKIHRATVTEADLNYEGSITIDRALCKEAGLFEFERVEVYNITNGHRFATYVIFGKKGEICVNGAAARLVQKKDLVIICAYTGIDHEHTEQFKPKVVLVDDKNHLTETILHDVVRA